MTKFREPFNGLSHLLGAIAALCGTVVLVLLGIKRGMEVAPLIIYGSSLMALFTASAVYHLKKGNPGLLKNLQRLDHSAIFLLIAGTYTPFCLLAFNGFYRWGLLGIIWSLALAGIASKFLRIRIPRWLNASIYVLMGWICIMAVPQMPIVLSSTTLLWLLVGGILYTFGAVIYAAKIFDFFPGTFGFHEVWHIFVLLGAVTQFVSVVLLVSGAPV